MLSIMKYNKIVSLWNTIGVLLIFYILHINGQSNHNHKQHHNIEKYDNYKLHHQQEQQHDFQFDLNTNDDLQELLGCPYSKNKIMLALVLREHSWNDIIRKKQDRAIKKLSKFFAVPEEFMTIDDAYKKDINEMSKYSIKKGTNKIHFDDDSHRHHHVKWGRIEFMIGCAETIIPSGQLIANQIKQQMKDGSIDDITGLDFGWWTIYTKSIPVNKRVSRHRRQIDDKNEGSGEEEDYEDYYDDDDDTENDDDDAAAITELPMIEKQKNAADLHPHRHHHGDDKTETDAIPTVTNAPILLSSTNVPIIISVTGTVTTTSEDVTSVYNKFSTTSENNLISSTTTIIPTGSSSISSSIISSSTQMTTPISNNGKNNNNFDTAMSSSTLATINHNQPIIISSTTEEIPLVTQRKLISSDPTSVLSTERIPSAVSTSSSSSSSRSSSSTPSIPITESNNDNIPDVYDDYDDEEEGEIVNEKIIKSDAESKLNLATGYTTIIPRISETTPLIRILATERSTTTEYIEPEPINYPPNIKTRLQKTPVTAGKTFSFAIPLDTFYDTEDGTNLKLTLLDKNDNHLDSNSWIQFNPDTREIYGLPLEENVSKWQYKLRATDSGNETVTETLDISVQQHKSHRNVNHEIAIGLKLNEPFANNVDWQIRLIQGIVETLGDNSLSSVLVREIRYGLDPTSITFLYTNESLPKDKCPEEKLDDLFKRLSVKSLSTALSPEITIKSVSGRPIGQCIKTEIPKQKLPTTHISKNYAPVPRNPVDRINATMGKLLVFKVPKDTFYDPEDGTDLELELTHDHQRLDSKNWLQFDVKNQEFYGIPKPSDIGEKPYILTAKDHQGLQAHDAMVVVVSYSSNRDHTALFEMTLGIQYEDFNSAIVQRRFMERVAKVFGDSNTNNIQVRTIKKVAGGSTCITYYNTTLQRPHVCPTENIEYVRQQLLHPDDKIKHRPLDIIGSEFQLSKIQIHLIGACIARDDHIHHAIIPLKPDEPPGSGFKDDYLLTFVLPAIIILAMLLVATIIACYLHRRRMTGKMELGDEEERRSFRSKGIPVIFQDELDEKPEIGNKSPIILKDEKPPLLPPSYNSVNPDDHEDMDEYVPPPAVIIGGRESRGKSPVTPSYRKPPPYVSP